MRIDTNKIDYLNTRFETLKSERSVHESLYRRIASLCAPQRGRYSVSDRNRRPARLQDILDESGLFARRILSAGLLSGLTSPSRPWYELESEDTDRNSYQPHKVWFREVRDRMLTVFRVSNTYTTLFNLYDELGPFGIAPAVIDANFDRVIHSHSLTVGQYCVFTDETGMVVGLMREEMMTVEQIVRRFVRKNGWRVVTMPVRNAYDRGDYDETFEVRHILRPRPEPDPTALDGQRFPFQSAYWQPEATGPGGVFLDDTGYDEQSFVCPRWMTIGNDPYGWGCGEEALGLMSQAQHMARTGGVALEMMVRPPMVVPTSLKRGQAFRPGSEHVVPDGTQATARPAFQINPPLDAFTQREQIIAERTYQAFYADVITAIGSIRRAREGADPTATEIQEIVGEKLQLLGPALERMQVELIEPFIERTFAVMDRAGLIPPAPEGLQGRPIKINHISSLAQAQRAVATRGMERSMGFAAQFAAVPGLEAMMDNVNSDEVLREFWTAQGNPPSTLNPREVTAQIREQRAQQAAQAQEMAAMQQAAGAARDLGAVETPTEGGNMAVEVARLAGLGG